LGVEGGGGLDSVLVVLEETEAAVEPKEGVSFIGGETSGAVAGLTSGDTVVEAPFCGTGPGLVPCGPVFLREDWLVIPSTFSIAEVPRAFCS